jgi:predicted AAA+ superfamily ATPase
MLDKIIRREKYLEQIYRFKNQNVIKVITGQRRSGKSFILKSIINDLQTQGIPEKNIIYINKEDLQFDKIISYKELHNFIEIKLQKINKNKRIYLLIDEVQEIVGFEKTVRSYALDKNFDIYITGSNSEIISSELSTYLGGRYIETFIAPLDFREFLRFSGLKSEHESLEKYFRYGGLPFIHNMPLNDELAFTYIKNIFNSILLKDVIKKFDIRNIALLEKLVMFLCGNIGFEFSANSISKYLKNEGVKVTPSVILDYLYALRAGYFIHEVKRYDLEGKRVFKQNAKYYVNDIGIRNSLGGFDEAMINQIMENVVFMQLKSDRYEVYTGALGDKEVDFVAIKNNQIKYIQVALTIGDKKTREREFGNLLKINDNFEKIVVSLDSVVSNYRGIKHLKLIDFLTIQ